jgi:hypothetical protein
MLKKDEYSYTAWHEAVRRGKVEVLDRLWEWAEKVLNRVELKEIASIHRKKNFLHHAALIDNIQIIERILCWLMSN